MDAHQFAQYVAALPGDDARPFSWAAEQVALLLAAHPDGVTDAIVRCHLHRAWAAREEDAVARIERAIDERAPLGVRVVREERGALVVAQTDGDGADVGAPLALRVDAALLGGGDAAVRASLAPGRRLQLRANGALAEEARAGADARPLPAPPFVALVSAADMVGIGAVRGQVSVRVPLPPLRLHASRAADEEQFGGKRLRRLLLTQGTTAAAADGGRRRRRRRRDAARARGGRGGAAAVERAGELLPLLLTPPGRPILLLGAVAVSAGSAEVGLDGVPGAPAQLELRPHSLIAVAEPPPPPPPSRRHPPPPRPPPGRRRPPVRSPPPRCCPPAPPPSPSPPASTTFGATPRRSGARDGSVLLTVRDGGGGAAATRRACSSARAAAAAAGCRARRRRGRSLPSAAATTCC